MFRPGPTTLLLAALLAVSPACHRSAKSDSFTKLIAGAKQYKGLFEVYQKDDRLYLVVAKRQLGQEYLLHARIARGIGIAPFYTGLPLMNVPVWLEEHAGRLFLMQRQLNLTGRGEMARAIERAYGPSVMESAKIEARRADGALVIDIHSWVLGELANTASWLKYASSEDKYSLSEERSYVESIRALPDNVNIRVGLTYTASLPKGALWTVADARAVPVSVQYQLVRLSPQLMPPRKADDRMGFFLTARRDFGSEDEDLFTRQIWRWRLEGAGSSGGLRLPRKPIVYYLDPAIPKDLRPVIKDAVLAWQPAFTAAGWKDAIRAELLPDGVDPEDLRYPLIHWDASEESPTGVGMPIVDPRSGEILSASITLNATELLRHSRSARRVYYGQGGPVALEAPPLLRRGQSPVEALALNPTAGPLEAAEMSSEFQAQRSLLHSALVASGELLPSDPLPQRVFHQYVKFVAMHEVGHTLGLRHNFKASSETPVDKLSHMAWVREHGLYGSVMDYPAVNLPRGRAAQDFLYYQDEVGSADRWTIAFGYAEDDGRAAALARQAAQPGHGFATDEDAWLGVDPTARTWDLGAEPLEWAAQRMATIRQLLVELPSRLLRDNAPYYQMSETVEDLLAQYVRAAAILPSYIGGQYLARDHVGDPAGRLPLQPVPKEKQLAALRLIIDEVFDDRALALSDQVLSRLSSHRWLHFGTDARNEVGSVAMELVSYARRALLGSLLNGSRLSHMRDGEQRFGAAAVLTRPELLAALSQALLGELAGGRPISAGRRELQQLYIEQLATFTLESPAVAAVDLRALARWHLTQTAQALTDPRDEPRTDEPYTRAHRSELKVRISKVLAAQIADSR